MSLLESPCLSVITCHLPSEPCQYNPVDDGTSNFPCRSSVGFPSTSSAGPIATLSVVNRCSPGFSRLNLVAVRNHNPLSPSHTNATTRSLGIRISESTSTLSEPGFTCAKCVPYVNQIESSCARAIPAAVS